MEVMEGAWRVRAGSTADSWSLIFSRSRHQGATGALRPSTPPPAALMILILALR